MTVKDSLLRIYNRSSIRFSSYATAKKLYIAGAFLIVLVAAIAGTRLYIHSRSQANTLTPSLKEVSLISIAELQDGAKSLEVTGTLRSKSEQGLRFEMPGRVTGVYATVGAYVPHGTLLAEVENSAQRAAVTQALGGLQAAQAQAKGAGASLSKIQGGTREEQMRLLETGLASAKDAQASAESSARNALSTAYANVEQALLYGSDALLYNASEYNPRPKFTVYDTTLKNDISALRVDIRKILDRQNVMISSTTPDIIAEIDKTLTELQYINNFYTKLFAALNDAVIAPEVEGMYAQTMSNARASILGTISSLTATRNGLLQANNQVAVAKANVDQGTTGAQKEDIEAVEAQRDAALAAVTSAQGSYTATLAALEKTRVRASIAGKVASFSAKTGDFVGTQTLGRIVGSGGYEVVFYIPTNDESRVHVGDSVIVAGALPGVVVSVSSDAGGLSGQLEVHANIQTTEKNLTNNSAVSVVVRAPESEVASVASDVFVPLSAIKFTASDTHVFTVEDTATSTALVALPVTLGTVVGNTVAITGVDKDTRIVIDARGLSAHQQVSVK